jgi:hypothetical protein
VVTHRAGPIATSAAAVLSAASSCTTGLCTFDDTGTSPGVTSYYKVSATNAVGTGTLSGKVPVTAH